MKVFNKKILILIILAAVSLTIFTACSVVMRGKVVTLSAVAYIESGTGDLWLEGRIASEDVNLTELFAGTSVVLLNTKGQVLLHPNRDYCPNPVTGVMQSWESVNSGAVASANTFGAVLPFVPLLLVAVIAVILLLLVKFGGSSVAYEHRYWREVYNTRVGNTYSAIAWNTS